MIATVIPARNAAETIAEALRSCLASARVSEMVVVSDGSTDTTPEVALAIGDDRVHVVHGPERGIAAALNAGFGSCTEAFVARCDADDLIEPSRFDWQVAALEADPSLVAVAGAFATMDHEGRPVAELGTERSAGDLTQALLAGETFTHFCAWLVRREAIEAISGAREWFETAEDLDLQFRLAEVGRVLYIPKIAYYYRLHNASITHRSGTKRREFFEACSREFTRQRAQRGVDLLAEGRPPAPPDASDDKPTDSLVQISGQRMGAAWTAIRAGQRCDGLRKLANVAWSRPLSWSAWKQLFKALLIVSASFFGIKRARRTVGSSQK